MVCSIALLMALSVASAVPAAETLAYYSDYFSFVGRDDRGRVAFALDTNRGQDGNEFQAERFVVLHDEHSGWQTLQGNGTYPNEQRRLDVPPDSEQFRFEGNPETGLAIVSEANRLTLGVSPVSAALERAGGGRFLRMGSTAGVLAWRGRRFEGRVIHENLRHEGWNRLTRTYPGFWRDFHGFYLVLEDPESGEWSDFYLHSQCSRSRAPPARELEGFTVLRGTATDLTDGEILVGRFGAAMGFYFWPLAWEGWAAGIDGPGSLALRLDLRDRDVIGNRVIGGFSMGIVTGEVDWGGRTWSAYGLGEIIK